ncbi:hypothetical protein [Pararhizobium sp. LjRoot238]|uniref:hypothetical protein n=1 Tax=Pararhizobium sp. LjRoot238 TaxID=3342293 RepID=UPI003ED11424
MKAATRADLMKRLIDLGAESTRSMGNRSRSPWFEERSAMAVSLPMSLLDELLDVLGEGYRPRGRPGGAALLSHRAFKAAWMIREQGAGMEIVETLAANAKLDKAQKRTLRVMVNEHLRRDQGSWEKLARKKWKLNKPI